MSKYLEELQYIKKQIETTRNWPDGEYIDYLGAMVENLRDAVILLLDKEIKEQS